MAWQVLLLAGAASCVCVPADNKHRHFRGYCPLISRLLSGKEYANCMPDSCPVPLQQEAKDDAKEVDEPHLRSVIEDTYHDLEETITKSNTPFADLKVPSCRTLL